MYKKTVTELVNGLKNKEFSSADITKAYLERIKKFDAKLNSFITVTRDNALALAKQIDDGMHNNTHRQATSATSFNSIVNAAAPTAIDVDGAHSSSQLSSALAGIPIAYKDIFCTNGIKTSCGSKMLDNFIAPYNATVVERLNSHGCVMLGKTNMDEFAMGSSNENSYYGAVKNPWDLSKVSGGSSGGSAAAVAARLTPIALGTDTGGSIRQPAAFCGVTGIKPTYGLVSRYGFAAFASSLDQAGILAQTAADIALLLQIIAGFDEKDSTSAYFTPPNYSAALNTKLCGLKIGLPKEYFDASLDKNIATLIDAAIKEFEKLGATVKTVSLPNLHLAISAYYVIAPAECSSNLARYDGIRYGYRCNNPHNLIDLYMRSRSEGFGAEVKRRIMIGTYVLSAGYYESYYLQAQKIRQLIKNDFVSAFEDVDVIACPTTPTTAFAIGAKTSDPVNMYLSDIYTVPVNMAGVAGIAFPVGFSSDERLPVSMQLIGNYFSEAQLLNAVHQYQQVTNWHTMIPAEFEF